MRAHRTDGVSLTFGLIFLAIVIVWLFPALHVALPNPAWFAAGVLIFLGLVGLIGVLRSDRRATRQAAEQTAERPARDSDGDRGGGAVGGERDGGANVGSERDGDGSAQAPASAATPPP